MRLLDSDASVRIMRNQPVFVKRLASFPPKEVFISVITYHELYYGALHSGSPSRHLKLLSLLCGKVTVLNFSTKSAVYASEIRQTLAAKGTPIGPLDTLIAGHALEHELTLVTGNVREFSRVDGLALENWTE